MKSIELFNFIKKYEEYIKLGLDTIATYFRIDDSLLIAYRRHKIPKELEIIQESFSLKYKFHGAGCLFIFDNKVIIEFDFRFRTFDYKGFNVGQLLKFISSLKEVEIIPSKIDIENSLLELVNEGFLSLNNRIDNVDTYDFFIIQQ